MAAVLGQPVGLSTLLGGQAAPGTDAIEQMVSSGLVSPDNQGVIRAQLAEAVPTLENGQWRLLPDSRMETTLTIRAGAQWHDGTPVTSDDLLFTLRVGQDRELPTFGNSAYQFLEGADATDQRSITLRWSRPYIEADAMFSQGRAQPLPRHLLEKAYLEDKPGFVNSSFWTDDFVGSGPYRLKQWSPGSHVVLQANDHYALGRPKIDEVEVRFIPDGNTMIANLLAGSVELTLGRTLSLEQGIQVRDQWRDGKMELAPANWVVIFPQFVNPNPAVVSNLQFRRALLHAIDRQQLVDELVAGLTSVAHSYLDPGQPQYREVDARLPRYEYDPRRSAQMIEGLGYTRGVDGYFHYVEGRRLHVEIRNIGVEIGRKSMFAVQDYWQRVGVSVEPVVIPEQRRTDLEYRYTFPAFFVFRSPNDLRGMPDLYSSKTPLPENNFRSVGNNARYMNPEFDTLLDRFYTTIPVAPRIAALGDIVSHIADQLNMMGLFYDVEPTMVSTRLQHVGARRAGSTQAWNANEWEKS